MYGGLGFSLKPPKWLRDLGARVLSDTHVSVPTPAGVPVTVDLGNPQQVAQVRNALLGTRVSIGAQAPSPIERASEAVSSIPGGWLTLAGGGLLLFLLMRRR